jgi:hypothetical protein
VERGRQEDGVSPHCDQLLRLQGDVHRVRGARCSLPPPSLNAPLHPHPRSFTYEVSLSVFFQDIVDNADLVSLAGRVTPRHCELLVGTGFTAATVRLMPSVQMIGEGEDSRILFGHRHCIVLSPAYWMRNKKCWFSGHPQAAAKKYTIIGKPLLA